MNNHSRRRYAVELSKFNYMATLTSQEFNACRARVVAIKGVRRSGVERQARGVDRMAREVAGYLVVTMYDISRTRVAKALNLNHTTVSKWCTRVERQRDNHEFDHVIASIEERIGCPV